MGWLVSGSASAENENTNKYGTRSPIISPNYDTAVKNYAGNLNGSGANIYQQTGLDWLSGEMQRRPVDQAVATGNQSLGELRTNMQGVNDQYKPFTTQAAYQLPNTPTATAGNAADYMGLYKNPWENDVVKSTLGNMDQKQANDLNGLRASRDAGSAFGDRANLSDGAFINQGNLDRAQTEAQIHSLGFSTGGQLAAGDASRQATNSQFNAGLLDSDNKFNVQSQQTNDAQKMTALNNMTTNLRDQAGLTQQQIDNVVTASGVNMDIAKSMLAGGSITQSQYETLVQMNSAYNGSDYTDNTNRTDLRVSAGFGGGGK